jgi:hypothetical protein
MEAEKKSGILEVIAIGVLLFMLWRMTHKKSVLGISDAPAVKPDEFTPDPSFNLNNYCSKVTYRPLSPNDLQMNPFLVGWCSRGDGSAFDASKGFGDAYADEQAKAWEQQKADESAFIDSMSVVQFRLINTTAGKITTNILNTTQDSSLFTSGSTPPPAPPVPGPPAAPVAGPSSGISDTGFNATLSSVPEALGYYLDVAYDSLFSSMVPGYNNKIIGLTGIVPVTALTSATNYYYRFRAFNLDGVSASSNVVNTKTLTIYNDYFLPSQDELVAIYTELFGFGVGGFAATGVYYSSTENGANGATAVDFATGMGVYSAKGATQRVRACRSFLTVHGTYALRDLGPAGGLIFIVIDNGNGTDTCYEAAASDQSAAEVWSNITSVLIGTTGAIIGTGSGNSIDIISQAGHTGGAAQLCKNLVTNN